MWFLHQYYLSPQKFGVMMQNVSAVKNYFKNPRWRTADTLGDSLLNHNEILQFSDFQDLGILKLKLLTAMHFRDVSCVLLNFVEISRTITEISQFVAF